MLELMKQWDGTCFADLIRNLPEADIPVEGVRGWLLENDTHQVVFFDIDPIAVVPPHSHCAQWGILLEGEMTLTIGDKVHNFKKGDWYFVPEGVTHTATFQTRVNVIDIFDSGERYKPKA